LLLESLSEAFREIADFMAHAAERAPRGTAWKAIGKAYLSPELAITLQPACPLVALAPALSQAGMATKPKILGELTKYKNRMLPFMPGRRAKDRYLSSTLGAVAIARVLPDPAARTSVLATARDFLLRSF